MKIQYSTFLIIGIFLIGTLPLFSQNADCINAKTICSKSSYHFDVLSDRGDRDDSEDNLRCSEKFVETNSIWTKWSIEEPGILSFVIDPHDEKDDVDFVLYQVVNSDCDEKIEVRCMASGLSLNENSRSNQPCSGKTGLSINSKDMFESSGCKYNDDNYLKYLKVEKGEEYVLFINNFLSEGGVSISFSGTADFVEEDCEEIKTSKKLDISSVYPNPAEEQISVEFEATFTEALTLEVLSLKGELISQQVIQKTSSNKIDVDIQDMASGSYIIRLREGQQSATKPFIKL